MELDVAFRYSIVAANGKRFSEIECLSRAIEGCGAFVCGEERCLMQSIAGALDASLAIHAMDSQPASIL